MRVTCIFSMDDSQCIMIDVHARPIVSERIVVPLSDGDRTEYAYKIAHIIHTETRFITLLDKFDRLPIKIVE